MLHRAHQYLSYKTRFPGREPQVLILPVLPVILFCFINCIWTGLEGGSAYKLHHMLLLLFLSCLISRSNASTTDKKSPNPCYTHRVHQYYLHQHVFCCPVWCPVRDTPSDTKTHHVPIPKDYFTPKLRPNVIWTTDPCF